MDFKLFCPRYYCQKGFEQLAKVILPACKHAREIHLMAMSVGLITALVFYFAPAFSWLYLFGILFLFLRLLLISLSQMMVEQDRKNQWISIMISEIADMFLMIGLIMSAGVKLEVALLALTACWAVSFFGWLDVSTEEPIQHTIPFGQADRLIALLFFSLLQFVSRFFLWPINFIHLFLWWIVLGGVFTVVLCGYRSVK